MGHKGLELSGHGRPSVAWTLQTIAIVVAVILLIWLLSNIVLLIFLAILIAAILRGTSDWAARRIGISEGKMLAVVTILVTTCVLGFGYYIGPRLWSESQDLWTQLQRQVAGLRQTYGQTPWGHAIFASLSPTNAVQSRIANVAGSVATSTLGGVVTGFVLIVTALYFAIAPQVYINGVVLLFPRSCRSKAQRVMQEAGRTLQWWSLGQLIDMTVVGVLTGFGLAVLGVPLSLALGVLAGVLTFVPYFGTILAAIPAMLVGLTVSWQTSLWTLAIFLASHTVEGYVVSPLVQRWTVHLPPAVSILSMTILATIFGPMGLVLGTPVAAALLVIVREAYVGGMLGDSQATSADDAPRAVLEAGPPAG